MGTAPGAYPAARPSGSCPGWAATGLAAVTLAIRVSSAVPPLLTAIVARAYGRRGIGCASGGAGGFAASGGGAACAASGGAGRSAPSGGEGGEDEGASRLLDYALPCRLAVSPSHRLAVSATASPCSSRTRSGW